MKTAIDGLKKAIEIVQKARAKGEQDMRQVKYWLEAEIRRIETGGGWSVLEETDDD